MAYPAWQPAVPRQRRGAVCEDRPDGLRFHLRGRRAGGDHRQPPVLRHPAVAEHGDFLTGVGLRPQVSCGRGRSDRSSECRPAGGRASDSGRTKVMSRPPPAPAVLPKRFRFSHRGSSGRAGGPPFFSDTPSCCSRVDLLTHSQRSPVARTAAPASIALAASR